MLQITQAEDKLNFLKSDIAELTSESIQTVVVAKTFPVEVYRVCQQLGLFHIGENKVQELKSKVNSTKKDILKDICLHFIGHLQTNKIKDLIKSLHTLGLIWSLDSLTSEKQLDKIEAVYSNQELKSSMSESLPVLLQVNSTKEENKAGIPIDEEKMICEMAAKCLRSNFVKLQGLMTIGPTPPPQTNFDFEDKNYVQEAQRAFHRTQKMRDSLERELGCKLPRLSMGMSRDYKIAIQEGSTEIRVGSLLLGKREVNKE